METGGLTLVTNAMAREVLVDQAGKAKAVSYVDKETRMERQVCAFVVADGACCVTDPDENPTRKWLSRGVSRMPAASRSLSALHGLSSYLRRWYEIS